MVDGAGDASATERADGRNGQEAGADRMGGTLNGQDYPPSRYGSCVGSRNHKFSHQGLHRTSKDERTVTTACLKRVCRMDLK
jgi:hypothetical protein